MFVYLKVTKGEKQLPVVFLSIFFKMEFKIHEWKISITVDVCVPLN